MFTGDPQLDRLQTLRRTAQGDGSRLLEELAASAPAPEARAEVLVALGDWQQWHGREGPARAAWQQAVAALEAAGAPERIAAFFGEPRELPDNGVFWQPPDADLQAPRPLVTARFEVNARGQARQVDAQTASGRESAYIGVARALRRLRFRPRFTGGEPVATPGVERRYEVYD
ncbi:hypothetical protein HRUBRA_00001 [Pseudohaliea rubra DSM 19751]|uniref:TonB C-terminal domain-containing protein n=1 Tax=Pseudohaliea rubra DSM 19751 TaxID=1265313 RepID=A0A095XZV9_9GAMM|nr:hypothetical protein HRUBRA_00001 [Pseudohaliea rubra DSM 19751]